MPFDAANYDRDAVTSVYPVSNPVTDLLERAWGLIDKPQKWCRGQPESADGRRRCSLTAVQVTAWRHGLVPEDYVMALAHLAIAMGPSIMGFNDRHTHREVAAAWQRAIELSRSHG